MPARRLTDVGGDHLIEAGLNNHAAAMVLRYSAYGAATTATNRQTGATRPGFLDPGRCSVCRAVRTSVARRSRWGCRAALHRTVATRAVVGRGLARGWRTGQHGERVPVSQVRAGRPSRMERQRTRDTVRTPMRTVIE